MSRAPHRQVSRQEWSCGYALRLFLNDTLTADQYGDLVEWVLDGGDLSLPSARPPWPWRR